MKGDLPSSSAPAVCCPNCGAALPARAPHGLCPGCLAAGLDARTEDEAEELSGPMFPAFEEFAPHFPQLEIIRCLGRGGMGVVYQARQRSLDRCVALKLLAPERVQDAKFADRFAREAQALARLSHPNIVTIHDFGQAGRFFYLLMEFVDGVNLRRVLRGRKLSPEEACVIVPPLCDALQYAHDRGVVHRDIKPENLLIDKDGRVKVADFGIATMLGTGGRETGLAETQPAGTPQYMAPEQRSNPGRVDNRADIYSLGVVFYEMLTGELPARQLEAPSRKVPIDVRLDEIVLRALEATPELRWQTAADLRTQVESFTTRFEPAVPLSVVPVPAPSRAKRWTSAIWISLAALAVIAVVLWMQRDPSPAARPSQAAAPVVAPPPVTEASLLREYEQAFSEQWAARKEAARLRGRTDLPADEIESRAAILHARATVLGRRRDELRRRLEDLERNPKNQTSTP